MTTMQPPKGYYFAFDGTTRTATGEPYPITGRLSCFGQLYGFKSKVDRDAFCNEYNISYNGYPKPCNTKTARRYKLGMSMRDYIEGLHYAIDLGNEWLYNQ